MFGILRPSDILLLDFIISIGSRLMECLLLLLIFDFMYALQVIFIQLFDRILWNSCDNWWSLLLAWVGSLIIFGNSYILVELFAYSEAAYYSRCILKNMCRLVYMIHMIIISQVIQLGQLMDKAFVSLIERLANVNEDCNALSNGWKRFGITRWKYCWSSIVSSLYFAGLGRHNLYEVLVDTRFIWVQSDYKIH